MDPTSTELEQLLEQAARGDLHAREQLLALHRDRLRLMVSVHLDRRVAARLDPSDVIQEALVDASQQLSGYLRDRPLPFYPWLRQIAWNRLIELYRKHVIAQKRSVTREESPALPDQSVVALAERLVSSSTPSKEMIRDELCKRVRQALLDLAEHDREVLVMRHLEQMPMAEIAAILGVSEGAVKVRHLRALRRLRESLGEPTEGTP